jgi:hypothetical protein
MKLKTQTDHVLHFYPVCSGPTTTQHHKRNQEPEYTDYGSFFLHSEYLTRISN